MDMRTGRLVLALGVAGVLAGSSSMAATPQPHANPDRTQLVSLQSEPPSEAPEPGEVNRAAEGAERVDAFARDAFPDTYSSYVLTDEGNRLTIYLTERDAVTEAALIAVSELSPDIVSFETRSITLVEQEALHSRIMADSQLLKDQGIELVYYGIDFATGKEELGIVGLTEAIESELMATYGPNLLIVDVPADERPVPLDRHNDSSPWNGGDFITSPDNDCSSGVPVHTSASGYYMITAAHCENTDDAPFYNRSDLIPRGTGNYFGFLAQRDGSYQGLDAELIFTATSDIIWTGYTFGAVRKAIAGVAGSPRFVQVCHSGAYEGEICDFEVTDAGCVDYAGFPEWCNLLLATGSNPQAVGQGDSGGPTYRYVSGLKVNGVVSGGSGPDVRCVNWYPQVTRDCYSDVWYTDIFPILNLWSLTVN